jgi:hypothetical protein
MNPEAQSHLSFPQGVLDGGVVFHKMGERLVAKGKKFLTHCTVDPLRIRECRLVDISGDVPRVPGHDDRIVSEGTRLFMLSATEVYIENPVFRDQATVLPVL